MRSLTQDDWLALGMTALAEAGPEALSVEAMTARAGRTRGSFYHHFGAHSEFITALATRWLETVRAAPLARIDRRMEGAMRRLAPSMAAEADALRVAALRARQGAPDSEAAADYAEILHALQLGLLARPHLSPERIERLLKLTRDMIDTHWND